MNRFDREKDKPLGLRWRAALFAGALITLGVAWGLSQFPQVAERYYTQSVGHVLGLVLGRATGWLRFSVAELILAMLAVYIIVATGTALVDLARGRRHVLNVLACASLNLLTWAAAVVVSFYVLWGFNYSRPDAVTRLGWQAHTESTPGEQDEGVELGRLVQELVSATNAAYAATFNTDDLGCPSECPMPLEALDAAIERSYGRVAQNLGLGCRFGAARPPAKPVAASGVMSRLLISGVYCPWTGEANFNRYPPACDLAHTVAHEKAHQRGITSEDEANFFGYLACAFSDQPFLRYSGHLFASQQLLRELMKVDPELGKSLAKQYSPGVVTDMRAINEYVRRYRGAASRASHAVNNAYLKANRVKGGVQSYRMSARLLVAFARQNGGTCLAPVETPPESAPEPMAADLGPES